MTFRFGLAAVLGAMALAAALGLGLAGAVAAGVLIVVIDVILSFWRDYRWFK